MFDIVTKTNSYTLEEFNEAFDALGSSGLIENRGTAKSESYYDMAHFFGAVEQSILGELATETQNIGNDVTVFKKYIHTEFVALKAEVGDIKKKKRICFDESRGKAGANLSDELISNSLPTPSQQKPSPSHIDPERVILQQQREIDFLRDEILSLNEIIKIFLRNQTQNQAAIQLECDVIKNSKQPNNVQWQEIPSRGPKVIVQQKAPLSSYDDQSLKQTPLHNRFSILETMNAVETINDIEIMSEEHNRSNSRSLLDGTPRKKQKKKVTTTMIIGDSIVKFVDGKQMHWSLQRSQNVLVKSFPGATTSHMKHHVVPCMEW